MGTILMDFESEDESKSSLSPKCLLEVIVVTHTGSTYHLSAPSPDVRDNWIVHIRAALECNFANTDLVEYKPSKACFDPPQSCNNAQCPKSGTTLGPGYVTGVKCVSCGKLYSPDHIPDSTPVLQIGIEETGKVCVECRNAQLCLVWLKTVIYVNTLALHEMTEEVLRRVDRFKASFKLRRGASKRLDMAATLKDEKQVSDVEFEELRRVDHEYRRENLLEEFDKMEEALEALGNDMQSLLGFLRAPTKGSSVSSSTHGTCSSENMIHSARIYYLVVRRLVQIADDEPDLVDFYWPQILQIHILLAKHRSLHSIALTDVLQQGIVAIALKHPHLALKLSWSMLASIGDFTEKKITQSQYAACVCLLLQLEISIYGVASSLTNTTPDFSTTSHPIPVPHDPHHTSPQTSSVYLTPISSNVSDVVGSPVVRDGRSVLQRVLQCAPHQNQELTIELYTLLRARKRLMQVQDDDMDGRRLRGYKLAPTLTPVKEGSVHPPHSDDHSAQATPANSTSMVPSEELIASAHSPSLGQFSCLSLYMNKYDSRQDLSGKGCIWKGLSSQLDFVEKLTDLVDYLRFIDRPLRTDTLKTELKNQFVNNDGTMKLWGLDPTGAAAEPRYRIHRIFVDETRVFRTKARAPSLIMFEVLIDESEFESMTRSESNSIDAASGDVSECSSVSSARRVHHASLVDGHINGLDGEVNQVSASKGLHEEIDVSEILLLEGLSKMKLEMVRERSLSEVEDPLTAPTSPPIATLLHGSHEHSHGNAHPHTHEDGHHPTHRHAPTKHHDPSEHHHFGLHTPHVVHKSAISPQPEHSSVSAHSNTTTQQGVRTRRLGSRSSGTFNRSTSSPEHHSHTNDPTDEFDVDIDPLQADGLPDEDAEVTKRVIESANNLLAKGAITQEEYAQLVQSDCKYRDEAKSNDKERLKAKIELYYGEEWSHRKQRLLAVSEDSEKSRSRASSRSAMPEAAASAERSMDKVSDCVNSAVDTNRETAGSVVIDSGVWPMHDLRSFIVKSNDDLRQEVACIQLIELCQEIFAESNLDKTLWLKPYRIVSTGPSAGFVETLPNTLSIDAIKKTEGFTTLPQFFESLYGGSMPRLHAARMNYVASLAAYSLVCYIFSIKDRHNGNILFDSEGHVIHIDFGFLLGIAPGGSFSVESAPFKLTDEMLEVFGGMESNYFSLFVKAFTTGFLALRSKSAVIVSAVEMMAQDSPFPCFQGKDTGAIVDKLKGRLRNDLTVPEAVEHCLDLITHSYSNLGTRQYDTFQWYTNGIVP